MVGVKMDSPSRELLTWTLAKVAKPGDRVIALHVLNKNGDQEGKSFLLSMVKAFDSILAVYEGFCNLKQVDLKLKICSGSSIQKVLVREAKSYDACHVIVGTAQNHHTIRSSASVAKYCAKKLSKECSILAIDNGKIVFEREASKTKSIFAKGIKEHRRNHLISTISNKLSIKSKALHGDEIPKETKDSNPYNMALALLESSLNKNCSICRPNETIPEDNYEDKSNSINSLIRDLPETKPGWPLLHRAILSDQKSYERSQISVVKWALQLPTRNCLVDSESIENKACKLDEKSGAIVLDNGESVSCSSSPNCLSEELEKYSAFCRLFAYQELVDATANFIPENLIGKGGSSQVYRGCLRDGKELAVKVLKPSEGVLKEFISEIEIITTLNHMNLISLFGFCFEDNHLILVYDLLSRGSLDENLHGDRTDPDVFGWSERYKVAIGVAEALKYLHYTSDKPVIHGDVKSSNILLSDDFEPQLADFGLAKWASTTSSEIICTDVAGTFGYLAPEYFMYGKVNERIDVYAYGVVLLELLSGRKPISDDKPKGKESLVTWAQPILNNGKISQLLDPSLGSNYNQDKIDRMVLAATLCIRRAPRARPTMNIVVKLLKGDIEVINWARQQVDSSEGTDMLDDDMSPCSNLESHLNLAFRDVEEDSLSIKSIDQGVSLEAYLKERWSRSSSFD